MRSKNDPTFVRHIDAAGYGAGAPRPMDEDDALEQAEAEIRRLKGVIATMQTESEFDRLERSVIGWARDRGIIPNATPTSQLLKAVSEMGELADATNKLNKPEIEDAVGDIVVCLINFCELQGMSISKCLEGAYNEIKHRKGKLMPGGVFVKEV
jgi:NTP pyrophosphatase (non-canonical NTP hydrolase)